MKLRLLLLLFSLLGSSLLNLILAVPPLYPSYVTTHQDGIINYRAQQAILFQNNTEIAIPFLISIKNYGVLLDNYSMTRVGYVRLSHRVSIMSFFQKKISQDGLRLFMLRTIPCNGNRQTIHLK